MSSSIRSHVASSSITETIEEQVKRCDKSASAPLGQKRAPRNILHSFSVATRSGRQVSAVVRQSPDHQAARPAYDASGTRLSVQLHRAGRSGRSACPLHACVLQAWEPPNLHCELPHGGRAVPRLRLHEPSLFAGACEQIVFTLIDVLTPPTLFGPSVLWINLGRKCVTKHRHPLGADRIGSSFPS